MNSVPSTAKTPFVAQKIIKESMEKAGRYNDELMLGSEADIMKKLEDLGMTIIEPDIEAFRKAAKKGLETWLKPEEYEFYMKAQDVK